ncbi:6693_t:CDS:2 [Funneliformis caledonium]|uniref:6693_t:CDS:1 n=1 Tax=Funneliformis caledonium TaxID=1117310 RepID=A0A9N9AFI4_9GLOM|nr:6693_t:CDS:2 [Funneliformis caledonium]
MTKKVIARSTANIKLTNFTFKFSNERESPESKVAENDKISQHRWE